MTQWSPVWRVKIAGVDVTDSVLASLNITSGRTNIYEQAQAGYCSITLIVFNQAAIDYEINDTLSVEVQDTSAVYQPIFGGSIVDIAVSVSEVGSTAYTQEVTITALGALARLQKALTNGVLTQDFDGDQIYALLSNYLLGSWNDVPPAETWATYNATETWENAINIGLGEIDQPGDYELISRASSNTDLYSLCAAIATSAFGVIYEEANGNIGYADSTHRQDYLAANGYTTLDANHANGVGLSATTRAGDLRNSFTINYDNNATKTYTATDLESQALYGVYAENYTSRIKKDIDAEALADRYVALRAFPYAKFQNITFSLGNPEIDDADRDALINIFLGRPVWIQNLPPNINGGSFQGYIEGWTFRASLNNLTVTFNASPVNFSQVAVKWEQVNAAETWNTLNTSLTWLDAIGVVA